jgi:hypothetical protein
MVVGSEQRSSPASGRRRGGGASGVVGVHHGIAVELSDVAAAPNGGQRHGVNGEALLVVDTAAVRSLQGVLWPEGLRKATLVCLRRCRVLGRSLWWRLCQRRGAALQLRSGPLAHGAARRRQA